MFKSKEELGGQVDPKIYRGGRSFVTEKKAKTRRQMGRDEMQKLLNKIKPLTKEAIQVAYKLMIHEDASETNRLKAAAFLVSTHQQLIKEIHLTGQDIDDPLDQEAEQDNQPAAILRLHAPAPQQEPEDNNK